MNKKPVLLIVAIGLMAVAVAALYHFKTHQRLGAPAIKAAPTGDNVVMKIELPEKVLDFWSTNVPESEVVTNTLPKDTSYAQRVYTNGESMFPVQANIILMGKDRTSIHKPEYCLQGQGIQVTSKENVSIPIPGVPSYELKVAKWALSKQGRTDAGQIVELHGFYVFWYVAEGEVTSSHWERMSWLARDLLTKGVLQRWAYVSYFTWCFPGEEDAAFERVKRLITESVPQFQLPPKSIQSDAIAKQ
jgi:hypothetical protein